MKIKKSNASNRKTIFCCLLLLTVMFCLGFSLFNRATYSSEEEETDSLMIYCADKVLAGENFNCQFYIRAVSINAKSFTFKYNHGDEISFDSFEVEPEDGWSVGTSSDDSITFVNETGGTGLTRIGDLFFSMSDSVNVDDEYTIDFVDSSMSDDGENVVNFDDVTKEVKVRAISDINTLDGITLDGVDLDGFDPNVTEYSVNIDSDKVFISTSVSQYCVVTGDTGEKNLNYGDNRFEIVVMSETGRENRYVINIYRYPFTTDVYDYFTGEEGEIYLSVGIDSNEEVLNNIAVIDGLNKRIEDGKLIISNEDDEILLELNLDREFHFTSEVYEYDEDENYLYVGFDSNSDILNKVILEDGLNKRIEDGKLIISNEDNEILLEVNIYREYHFTSDVYDYINEDEEEHYLYVGFDSDSDILNKVILEDGLNKRIEDGKLIISNSDEVLLELDILRITNDKYLIEDNKIVIDSRMKYGDFFDSLNLIEELSITISNDGESIENDDIIEKDMVLEIYFGISDVPLDSYTIDIKSFELVFNEELIIDNDNKYVKYINFDTTVGDLISKINLVGGSIKIFDSDEIERGESSTLATGDKLIIYKDGDIYEEYTLSVMGDGNGDGNVGMVDLVQMRKHYLRYIDSSTGLVYSKTGVYYFALDLDQNQNINLVDLVRIKKIIVGAQ